MSRTARLSEETHRKVKELAEERDVPVSQVLDEIVNGQLEDAGISLAEPAIGYCPTCGFKFTQRDVTSPFIGPDKVRCPVPSCTVNGAPRKVSRLVDEPPAHAAGPITRDELDQFEDGDGDETDGQ